MNKNGLEIVNPMTHSSKSEKPMMNCPEPDCDKMFTAKHNMKYHTDKHHPGSIHIEQIEKVSEHVCKCCNADFDEKLELRDHLKRYRDSDKNYICPELSCATKYDGRKKKLSDWCLSLIIHMKEFKTCMCSDCGKLFYLKMHLMRHENKDHV